MANYIFLCDVESKRLVRKRERERRKKERKEGRMKYRGRVIGAGRNYETKKEGTRRREKGVAPFIPILVKATADNRY